MWKDNAQLLIKRFFKKPRTQLLKNFKTVIDVEAIFPVARCRWPWLTLVVRSLWQWTHWGWGVRWREHSIHWWTVVGGSVIGGSWGRRGGNEKDRGCRAWWGIGGGLGGRPVNREGCGDPTFKLPVSLSQALSLLLTLPFSFINRPPPSPPVLPSPTVMHIPRLFDPSLLPQSSQKSPSSPPGICPLPWIFFWVFSAHKILPHKD